MELFYIALLGIIIYFNRKSLKRLFNSAGDFLNSKKRKESDRDYYSGNGAYGSTNSSSNSSSSSNTWGSNYSKYKPGSNYYKSSTTDDKFLRIMADMKMDFLIAPYADKFDVDGYQSFIYHFENNRTLSFSQNGKQLNDNGTILQLSSNQMMVFLRFFTDCISKSRGRKGSKTFTSHTYSSSRFTTDNKNYTEEQLKNQKLFWKLKKNKDLRMENINKMRKDDPDRESMVNEVNVVINKMKEAYEKSGLTKS